MHTETHGETLLLTDIPSLTSANGRHFKELAQASLKPEHRCVEVDLSVARFMDSEGLGALISVHKTMCSRAGCVRLRNPTTFVVDLLKLLRLDGLFPVVQT